MLMFIIYTLLSVLAALLLFLIFILCDELLGDKLGITGVVIGHDSSVSVGPMNVPVFIASGVPVSTPTVSYEITVDIGGLKTADVSVSEDLYKTIQSGDEVSLTQTTGMWTKNHYYSDASLLTL